MPGAAAPFCPGGRDVGARCRAVEELDQVCGLAAFRQQLEECLEYPGAAEPPKPLPHAVPFAKFTGERTPRYAMHRKVVDGFQEVTVIMPGLSPARLRRIKHIQHDRPIAFRHSRQHVRLPAAGHAVIRTKPDSGTRQKSMSGIPSTRPRIPLSPDQRGSLVDFVYQMGEPNFSRSTLLTVVNSGHFELVPNELKKWVIQGGKPMPGLARRRDRETQIWTNAPTPQTTSP